MGANSKISWTDHTFNPVWGCVRVSPGCEHCYAETFARRLGLRVWGPASTTPRRTFGEQHWAEPLTWNRDAERAGERRRVFCASMADVFEDHEVWITERPRLWALIRQTPHLDWLVLTKRPERLADCVPWMRDLSAPWPNVWLGTTAESQTYADERIPLLLNVPAVVHFLSCEPLLGPIDLHRERWQGSRKWYTPIGAFVEAPVYDGPRLHWVVCGGESGPGYRPLNLDWARSLRDQCQAAGVPFHFKQIGGRSAGAGGRLLDGRVWDEFPEPSRA